MAERREQQCFSRIRSNAMKAKQEERKKERISHEAGTNISNSAVRDGSANPQRTIEWRRHTTVVHESKVNKSDMDGLSRWNKRTQTVENSYNCKLSLFVWARKFTDCLVELF